MMRERGQGGVLFPLGRANGGRTGLERGIEVGAWRFRHFEHGHNSEATTAGGQQRQ